MSDNSLEISTFSRVKQPQTTVETVERQIKEMIRSGILVAGTGLPAERQLAEHLNISRTALREALQSLTRQGVLQVRKSSGWTVGPNQETVVDNLEVYFLLENVSLVNLVEARLVVEPETTAFAALRRTSEQLDRIEQALNDSRNAQDPETFFRADTSFHAYIAETSSNPLLILALRPLFGLMVDVRQGLAASEKVISDSHIEHTKIFDAIRDKDPVAARAAASEHAHGFLTRAQQAIADDPKLAGLLVRPQQRAKDA